MTPHWTLSEIDFRDLDEVLTRCGNAAVKEIIDGVDAATTPEGLPQKENKESTKRRKGHPHPLIEHRRRFTQRKTYLITPQGSGAVRITIANPADSNIAAHLENAGYHFFGLTDNAYKVADKLMDAYIVKATKASFEARK